jgi:hypothetical protein
MEQMIWLAPWVLTEIWLSAFETLMSVVAPLRKNVALPLSRAMCVRSERRVKGSCHKPTM